MKTALVLGAGGFIGSHLVKRLNKEGYWVRGVDLKYPEFSVLERANKFESVTDMAFDMIAESVEYIFDGEQYYYAAESEPDEIIEFIESLNQDQFNKIENFFNNLPKLNKKIEMDCKKCNFHVF